MKYLSAILSLLVLSCSTPQNKLENKTQRVEFQYIMWSCACANWATPTDINAYRDTGNLSTHCVFVEPADNSLKLPDSLGNSGDIVQFTGQYYIDKGFPNGYIRNEEPVEKAKVFHYTSYKIIKSNYRKNQTSVQ